MKPIFYLFLFLPELLWSQNDMFEVQHLSIKDGLPDNQTVHIEQDKDGYIWGNSIGILFRYDGYQFKTYRKWELNIQGLRFVNFAIDDEGLVWYFDYNNPPWNIQILDASHNTFTPIDTFFNNKLPFPSGEITRVYRDKQLGFVILTKNNGFYTYNNKEFELLYQHYAPIEYSRVRSTKNGDKWFFHQDTLFQISTQGQRSFTIRKSIILDVLPIEGSLYVWYDSFYSVDKDRYLSEMTNYLRDKKPVYEKITGQSIVWLEDKTPNLRYHSPIIDKENYQWIIEKQRNKNTIIGQDQRNEIIFQQTMPLNRQGENNQSLYTNIRELYTDKQNNLWVTSDNGLYKISRHQIPFKSYLQRESTRGIIRLGNELLVNHNKVSTIDLETDERLDFNLPFKRLSFFKDKDKLWVGTDYGVTYWNKDWNAINWTKINWKGKVYLKGLKGYSNITPYRPRNSEYLWMGTDKGLTYLNHKTDIVQAFVSNNDRLNTSIVRYVYENKKGIWWVTDQGVFLANTKGKVLKEYSIETGFPTNDFYHLYEDKEGVFWFGTADIGLLRWNPVTDEKQVFGREKGFLNENIYAVYEDDYGFLWLPSDYGLIRFNKETYDVNTYLEEHGLPNNEFNTYSHYQDSLGNLYFGGLNGIITFHPKDFLNNTSVDVPLHLTACKVLSENENQAIDCTDKVRLTKKIIFRPEDKFIETWFALMDFKNTEERLYAYKIKGFDNDWRYTTDNFIRIYSLPYGKYELVIKGQVDGVAWSSRELVLDVHVLRPFYLQAWFIILVIGIIGLSILLFFKNRTRLLIKEQVRLEKIVKERTAKIESDKQVIEKQAKKLQEMDNAKTKFFSNITHEFRTPLTLILGPVRQLYKEEKEPKKQKQLAGVFKNARHLSDLINQLLDLSKLESHKMTMSWEYGDIIEYTKELFDSFMALAQSKQQNLLFVTNQTVWETYFDKDKWHKIVFNLLSNAIKYTEDKGKIELTFNQVVRDKEEIIHLTVKDNGVGIREEDLTQIFNRFYQVDDSTTRFQEGAGIGLSLVKELIELQGGTIDVKSVMGEGTTFEVKISIPQNVVETIKVNSKETNNLLEELEKPTQSTVEIIPQFSEGLHLLIIEDNADMRDYIQSCLNTTKYKVTLAKDGVEGIEKAFEIIPDLIISDVMMPRKDGFEVVTAIRQNLATSHIPVVLLTAKSALDSRLEGLKRGVDAYMAKPFSPKELVARIAQLIKVRQLVQQRYQNITTELLNDESTGTYEKEDVFITEFRAYIQKNIGEQNLFVESIAKHFFMSRMQLYRKIKALTNETTANLISKMRLEVALELMNNKELTLSEIAYQTGFTSPSHFSTVFKRTYGKSPSKFRDLSNNG